METTVKIDTMHGPYDWCNVYKYFYLTFNTERLLHKIKKNIQMVKIEIQLSNDLKNQIDHIEIYDMTGFVSQYITNKEVNNYTYFFNLHLYKDIDNYIHIKFKKNIKKIKNFFLFCNSPKTIDEKIIQIPFEIKGDDTMCTICLDNVDDKRQRYISSCKHIFHVKCIYEYVNHSNGFKTYLSIMSEIL